MGKRGAGVVFLEAVVRAPSFSMTAQLAAGIKAVQVHRDPDGAVAHLVRPILESRVEAILIS